MKRACLLAIGGLVCIAAAAQEAFAPDEVIGLWATEKGKAHVEIFRQDESHYAGRIVWLKEPRYPPDDPEAGLPKHDRENPAPDLRDRPIEGLQIMRDFEYAGDGRWEGGRIYDPENGKTYKCVMWLTESGTLKVRGYVGFALLGRTEEWLPVVGAGEESE